MSATRTHTSLYDTQNDTKEGRTSYMTDFLAFLPYNHCPCTQKNSPFQTQTERINLTPNRVVTNIGRSLRHFFRGGEGASSNVPFPHREVI